MSLATANRLDRPDIAAATAATMVAITPEREAIGTTLRELWRFRELFYFLAWRDLKVRYKQTILGVLWAILQPLVIALTLGVFLGRLANLPSDGVPYAVFVYAAMLLWQLFSHVITESSQSLIANERLVTKVYFPRVIVPLSTVIGGLVDFLFGLLVMVLFLVRYHLAPSAAVFTFPLFVVLAAVAACGAGLWLSALNVKYRDVRYTLGFVVQAWFFLSPIAYSSSVVPARWRMLYAFNPMAGAVDGIRWAFLGTPPPAAAALVASSLSALLLLLSGALYFRHAEAMFADLI